MMIGPREFAWGGRTYIMGVINVSPDSFSGDGLATADAALEQARRFARDGADILDVGGQSTRPGATKSEAGFEEISEDEEIRRVVPVIERIRLKLPGTTISVDTYKPGVARAAIDAGAHLLNDIEGFRRNTDLARIAADAGVPAVVMHNQRRREAHDVIGAISAGLMESLRIADDAGLPRERLIIDPGFGFGCAACASWRRWGCRSSSARRASRRSAPCWGKQHACSAARRWKSGCSAPPRASRCRSPTAPTSCVCTTSRS